MEFAHLWLFVLGFLILAGILAGRLSTRVGAPVLLVFLALGMLAGEDGIGGIAFGMTAKGDVVSADLDKAYLIGSAALSLILFDGGLRTTREYFRLALWPAVILATVGVVVTALVTGGLAAFALHRSWLEGLLIGSIVASTDAAAVFVLLHHRGARLNKRVNATLDVESGINDPVAILLTTSIVSLLSGDAGASVPMVLWHFAMQAGLGALAGIGGGKLLARLINQLELEPGLYPILALAGGIMLFAGTQMIGGSGFLAVYLGGIVLGNSRLRALRLISRFLDGIAWLAQIVLFVMLGLLVSPHALLPDILPALAVAAALTFVARPLGVVLCLAPFRFTPQETAFISWVGLRGAVPIFLAMFPLVAGLPGAASYFNVAFVVVIASLLLQGWTVSPALRWLGLELPAAPESRERIEFDLPAGTGREIAAYRVAAGSPALDHDFVDIPLPRKSRILGVLRGGTVLRRNTPERLQPRDVVLAMVPLEHFDELDRLFALRRAGAASDPLGDFVLEATVPLGEIADLYGLPAAVELRALPLGKFVQDRLRRSPTIGDRIHFGPVDFIVRDTTEGKIARIGLSLEPARHPFENLNLTPRLRRLFRMK